MLGSVIVEALVIGLLASVIGLFAGLGLAVGLNKLFTALNLDLPQTQTVFATRTIVVSLLVGTLVTLFAGLSPALRATRVPPIAAVREGATLPRSALSRFSPYIAVATIVLAVLALSYALLAGDVATGDRFILLGIGVLALFVGVALISSQTSSPLRGSSDCRRAGGRLGRISPAQRDARSGRTPDRAALRSASRGEFVGVSHRAGASQTAQAIEEQIGRPGRDLAGRYSESAAVGDDAAGSREPTSSATCPDSRRSTGSGANLRLDEGTINGYTNSAD